MDQNIQAHQVNAREEHRKSINQEYYAAVGEEEHNKFLELVSQDRMWIDSAKMLYQVRNGTPFAGTDEEAIQSGLDWVESFSRLNYAPGEQFTREQADEVLDKIFTDLDGDNDAARIAGSYLFHTFAENDPVWNGINRVSKFTSLDPDSVPDASVLRTMKASHTDHADVFSRVWGHVRDNFQAVLENKTGTPYLQYATPGAIIAAHLPAAVKGIVKGVPDAAQGVLDLGTDIDNVHPLGKIVWGRGNGLEWIAPDDPNYQDMPTLQVPQFPSAEEDAEINPDKTTAERTIEDSMRPLSQFITVFAAGGGLAGTIMRGMAAGGLADATFDPEMGNLSTVLEEMGIKAEIVQLLNSQVGEDATAVERLRARGKNAVEGSLLSVVIEPLIMAVKRARDMGAGPAVLSLLEDAGDKWKSLLPVPGQLNMGIGSGGGGTELVSAVPKTTWDQVSDSRILQEAKRIKRSYMRKDGWAAIEPVKGGVDKDGKAAIEFKKIPYDFHKPRGNISKEGWAKKLTSRMVSDIDALVSRAAAGDESAQSIIAQATWYRDMRARLRSEFGGLGDLFADVIGATSAQTNVTQNWDNAIEIMRRFSRGEYDQEVNAYLARLESGEGVNPTELTRLHNSGEFSLITKAAGELFNTNSPAATGALVGIFRDIKAGRSPKTPNFTGNLIGYTNEATVDVWAARYLRNAAGLPYIPPPAEKAVGGKHLVGSTIDEPRTGAEFGFGQKVFSAAADQINESGVIREFDESLGNLGPDDLQAVVWFLEKEKWTERGWTNRAGEGGSLDMEASYAGSQNPERIKELRSILNSKEGESLPPAQRQMLETELAELAAPLERTVLGLSGERPGQVPTNQQQLEMAQQLDSVVRDDQSVVAYKTTNTYGRFMGDDERAIDAEFVTREDFDPTELTQAVIRLGKEKDQDSVFVSRVVTADHANARPGVEVYFTHSGGPDRARELSDKLTEYGIDGFTYITDARQADRIEVQAGTGEETAAIVGFRVQYIPEFEFDNWAQMSTAEKTKILETRETEYQQIAADLIDEGDVSQVNAVYYDTDVIKRGEYDARLRRPNSPRRKEVRQGSQTGADAEISAANAGNQRTRNVSDRQRAEGDA